MIKIEKLSYSFPQKDLYDKISFSLEQGQHCAFIGTSGSGKSTLIDMMIEPEEYLFDGKIVREPDCRIGYVSQFSQLEKGKELTVFEYIGADFIKLQKEIDSLCGQMEVAVEIEPVLEAYQNALDAFEAIGGDDYESNIIKKLNLADLAKQQDLMVSKLSGGEFKLVQVIKEMLTSPEVLIMDEPDVFLDFEHLNALKNLMNAHKGILLVITHNRYLLNHCFNKVIHLENKQLQEFEGNYLEYNFSLLQRKIELQELAIADTLEIERNEQIIDRLRAVASVHTEAARGKSLHARVKLQERLEARRIEEPFVDIKVPQIHLIAGSEPEDEILLRVEGYHVGFQHTLLEQVDFQIAAKDKVALVGANGTGKTTLLSHIYKNTSATIQVSEGVEMGFLSQRQGEMLQEDQSILDELYPFGFQKDQEVIDYAATYGFDPEAIHQKIGSLSGGEKNILQLAKLSASRANLLLLDEPTSHLDTYAQLALEQAIKDYQGGIIMISHDFYTIANSMDYVLLIENKTIRKMSIRRFRKMIYAKHFDRDYLAIEQKKKEVETQVELALRDKDFEKAKVLLEKLQHWVEQLMR